MHTKGGQNTQPDQIQKILGSDRTGLWIELNQVQLCQPDQILFRLVEPNLIRKPDRVDTKFKKKTLKTKTELQILHTPRSMQTPYTQTITNKHCH